jgi:hypothetical protein
MNLLYRLATASVAPPMFRKHTHIGRTSPHLIESVVYDLPSSTSYSASASASASAPAAPQRAVAIQPKLRIAWIASTPALFRIRWHFHHPSSPSSTDHTSIFTPSFVFLLLHTAYAPAPESTQEMSGQTWWAESTSRR